MLSDLNCEAHMVLLFTIHHFLFYTFYKAWINVRGAILYFTNHYFTSWNNDSLLLLSFNTLLANQIAHINRRKIKR